MILRAMPAIAWLGHPCRTGQRRAPRQREVHWSSRLGVGLMGQHFITCQKKNTHAKKPRQRLGKTDGLSNKRHRARKRLMNYGTWNVQGIRGKMEKLTSVLGKLKMDVIGLTETKRKGTGTEIVKDYVHLYSGVSKDRREERGVSILINKKFKKGITNWEAVNENIITVNINHLGN